MTQPTPVRSQAGIKRDGTRFDGQFYTDGQWVRFQRGLPRKMGGYRSINSDINGIVRQFHTEAQNGVVYTHVGHSDGVQRFTIDTSGNTSAPSDRTPLTFTPNDNFMWQFDAMFDGAGGGAVVIAHAAETALDISSGVNYPVYIGDIYGTGALTEIPTDGVCGGIVVLHPYLFMFSKTGFVKWSDINDPTNFTSGDAGSANVTSAKIVRGIALRGGGQSPSGLLWSLDSLIRASYTGGTDVFRFDTISSSISVLASNGIIEYDGVYYWCGLDRFMYYNGVVQDLPNTLNTNFFFDNMNYANANKVFAFKVPRFGEIWWCFPKGESTECNHAVIYNVRENTWYDTALPEGGRSAGIYAQVFRSPLLAGIQQVELATGEIRVVEPDESLIVDFISGEYFSRELFVDEVDKTRKTEDDNERITDTGLISYKIWRHETGVDVIDGSTVNAIRSYFETGPISLLTGQTPALRALSISAIEPDFVQSGDMIVQVGGYINAKANTVLSSPKQFPAVPSTPDEEVVKFKELRRIMTLRFESNTVGGDYQMGNTIAHIQPADGRYQS